MLVTLKNSARVALLILFVLGGLSVSALQAQTVDVDIPGLSFEPQEIIITEGMTVRWTNNHTITHTSTSIDGVWDSGDLAPGESFSFTFDQQGSYDYVCSYHPGMTGKVIVHQELYTIPELYANLDLVENYEVRVYGAFVGYDDRKLVVSYEDYERDELMDPFSVVFLEGFDPLPEFENGGIMIVRGIVTAEFDDLAVYPEDTMAITIIVGDYEYLIPGENIFDDFERGEAIDFYEQDTYDRSGCDSCKFAILISGGGSASHNKPTYWKNISDLYKYKTDTTANGGHYCPENVKVLYFDGDSDDTATIPHSAVDSCTKAKIQAAHTAIAQKIAQCKRDGKDSEVQKMVTNHGSSNGNIVLLGTERLSGGELRGMQQELIDSCCKKMIDEMTQCYGGAILDSLKSLNDTAKTEMHMNSAAGSSTCGWSSRSGGHVYLKEKIARLRAGDDYEEAVRKAKDKYRTMLDSSLARRGRRLDSLRSVLDTLTDTTALRRSLDSTIRRAASDSTDMDSSRADGSPSWVRFQFDHYCEWKRIEVPPGGQFRFEFEGAGACGNVSIYREQPDGSKVRVFRWNWNLPGSSGYSSGNDKKTVNVNDVEGSTGIYWVHNDNGKFTLTVTSRPNQDGTMDAMSNPGEFANASAGGSDNSSDEFRSDISTSLYIMPLFDQDEVSLKTLPGLIGPCGGVERFETSFMVDEPNPWWDDMELYMNINEVLQPGILTIECPSAMTPIVQLDIFEPGEYTAHLGGIMGMGEMFLAFDAFEGFELPCFTFDSWAIRSLVSVWPEFLCGDANADLTVNVSDAVWIINFVFVGGEPPMPYEAGDANCDTTVNVSDAVWIINYVFVGGPQPCECK